MTTGFTDNTYTITSWLASGFDGLGLGRKRFFTVLPCHRNRAKGSEFAVSGFGSTGDGRGLHFLAPFGLLKEKTGLMLDRWTCKRIGENG